MVKGANTMVDGVANLLNTNTSPSSSGAASVNQFISSISGFTGVNNNNTSSNININQILISIDSNADGNISDIELAKAVLAQKRGEFGAEDINLVNDTLNKNPNRSSIENALRLMDSNNDGRLSDSEVLRSLKDSGINLSIETKRAILQENQNFNAIQRLLANNNFSDIAGDDDKTFSFLLKARRLKLDDAFAENELQANPHLRELLILVKAWDPDANGSISNKEFVDGLLAIKKGVININIDFAAARVVNKYPNYMESKNIIDKIAPQGTIEINNVTQAIAEAKQSTSNTNLKTLLKIVKENSDNPELKKLIGLISTRQGLSKDELTRLILQSRSGEFNNSPDSINFFNSLIALSADATLYQDSIKEIDSDHNGIIDNSEVKTTLLRFSDKRNDKNSIILPEQINKILSTNSQFANIKKLIEVFDADPNNFGTYTDSEILQGLLKLRTTKLKISTELLQSIIGDNSLLGELPSTIALFDTQKDGQISEEEYARVMLAISKGEREEIDNNILKLIESTIPNAEFIKETIRSFDGYFDENPNPSELVQKYKELARNNSGTIETSKLSTLTKIMGVIYPGAGAIINLHINMEKDGQAGFSDQELASGVLIARSGSLGKINPKIMQSLLEESGNAESIQHTCDLFDSNKDGKVSDFELVSGLVALKQNAYQDDELFNVDIANAILQSNSNYNSINQVISKFNYSNIVHKPSSMNLLASLLIQEKLGTSFSTTERTAFIKAIGLENKQNDIDKIKALISPTPPASSIFSDDDFDSVNKTSVTDAALMDKLLKIAKGELQTNSSLIGVLRTNSNYDRINAQFKKYMVNKKFTEDSLIKVLIDANLDPNAVANPKEILTSAEKNYFLGLITADNPSLDHTAFENAVSRLDTDGDGKMTEHDHSLHSFILNDKLTKNDASASSGISYDFNNDGKVDAADQEIFNKVTNYLKK